MKAEKIPDIIVGRLPIYLRALQRMADNGLKTTSSQELGEHVFAKGHGTFIENK